MEITVNEIPNVFKCNYLTLFVTRRKFGDASAEPLDAAFLSLSLTHRNNFNKRPTCF